MIRPKVDGIYDLRTIEQLLKLGVRRFSFDLRPRSLNFIQHYRVHEILKQIGLRHDLQFSFHFADENSMLIEKFLTDLQTIVGASQEDWDRGLLLLEFSGREDFEILDQFERPYRWHLFKNADWGKASRARSMKGVTLNFNYLAESFEAGMIHSLCSNLHTIFSKQTFHLERQWDSNVFPSLLELFDFEDVALMIDQHVEVCFRNVDAVKLATGLKPFLSP